MKKIKQIVAILVAFILLVLLVYSQQTQEEEMFRYRVMYLDLFDTQTEIIGYGTSQEEFENQAEKLRKKLAYYHRLFDIYNDYEGLNNIKTINDQAGIAPVKVDLEIVQLLKFSKEMYELTNGEINVAMGSVLAIWHECRQQATLEPDKAMLPDMEELKEAALHVDMDKLIIDENSLTVFLEDAEMSLDVGSIGKGYAVQKTAEFAEEIGMENVLISVGGNIATVGTKADGSSWQVGIQNPDLTAEKSYVESLNLLDGSLVTSGSYQRYYIVDGVSYCHIIDPDTLMPGEYFDSVSIVAGDSGLADALSTAVFNMTLEEGLVLINGLDGVEAMWILKNGEFQYSEGWKEYITQ